MGKNRITCFDPTADIICTMLERGCEEIFSDPGKTRGSYEKEIEMIEYIEDYYRGIIIKPHKKVVDDTRKENTCKSDISDVDDAYNVQEDLSDKKSEPKGMMREIFALNETEKAEVFAIVLLTIGLCWYTVEALLGTSGWWLLASIILMIAGAVCLLFAFRKSSKSPAYIKRCLGQNRARADKFEDFLKIVELYSKDSLNRMITECDDKIKSIDNNKDNFVSMIRGAGATLFAFITITFSSMLANLKFEEQQEFLILVLTLAIAIMILIGSIYFVINDLTQNYKRKMMMMQDDLKQILHHLEQEDKGKMTQ